MCYRSRGGLGGGPGGTGPPWVSQGGGQAPLWDTWEEENKLYSSTSIHCKQKTWCYFLLEYNKITHHILLKGENLIWRESIKNKVEEYKYSVDRVMSSQWSSLPIYI